MKCKSCQTMPPRCDLTLTVEKPGPAVDAAGHPDLTNPNAWVTVGTIRARAVTRGGKEAYVFKQTQADTTTVFYTPKTQLSASLHKNTDWRLRRNNEVYEITYADVVNKTSREVMIEAKEAV